MTGKGHNPLKRKWGKPNQQREERLERIKAASKLAPKVQTIPPKYQDLAEAFSEKECNVLPPTVPQTVQLRFCQGQNYQRPR